MRRIILVGTVAIVMVAMLVALALPALAAPPPTTHGQFTCERYNPFTGQYEVVNNVQRGQLATYTAAGYYCYRGS
jgi:multisubunit Na+/H+ antiporter MnhB subunit